jgi:hypothetical protein
MGCCFGFPAAVIATIFVGLEYGKSDGLITFAAITLVSAIATAWWSAVRAGRD